ncbi:MAG: AraC family transcriptional regulator [Bacteroidota bacterium]
MKTLVNSFLSVNTTMCGAQHFQYDLLYVPDEGVKKAAGYEFAVLYFIKKDEVVEEHVPPSGFIGQLKQLIHDNLDDPDYGKNELSRAVHLSPSQLYRRLKSEAGFTPNLFIRKIKMEKAQELLTSSSLNISEIAYTLGFNDPNYFSRIFQREFGVSPRSFRKC